MKIITYNIVKSKTAREVRGDIILLLKLDTIKISIPYNSRYQ